MGRTLHAKQRTWKLEKIQLQSARHNRNLVFLQQLLMDWLAVIDLVTEMMRSSKRHIGEPDSSSRLVAFKIGIVCYF